MRTKTRELLDVSIAQSSVYGPFLQLNDYVLAARGEDDPEDFGMLEHTADRRTLAKVVRSSH